jgi:putative transposase
MIRHVLLAALAGWMPRHQQQVITSLPEENRALTAHVGSRQLRLTDTARRRLAALAYPLGRTRLQAVATMAPPDPLRRWYHRLIAQPFDGSWHRRHRGRPRVAEEIEPRAIHMAEAHATRGSRRIQGALADLGFQRDAGIVRHILHRYHLDPAPRRRQVGVRWAQFLKRHWEVPAATDGFTVEVATLHGLVTYDGLCVMAWATRRVPLAGMTPHPTETFMTPCARPLTDPLDGFRLGTRYLLHDRDETFVQGFDRMWRASGVAPITLPPRRPHRNADGERFVRSIKEAAPQQMLARGAASLRSGLQSYLTHDHHERHRQGLANHRIAAEPAIGNPSGQVRRRARLGGLLTDDYGDAA